MIDHPGLRPAHPLRTERLLLRPHTEDDVADLLRFHGDPDVVRYVPWPVRDRAAVEEALTVKVEQDALTEPGQWLVLAIELGDGQPDAGRVVGEVLLKWDDAEAGRGEIGFALAADQQGRGIAAEAAREVLRLGFEDLALHKITAVCVEGNDASVRLLERLGFRLEARLVDHAVFKGERITELHLGLLEDAWRAGVSLEDRVEIEAAVHAFLAAFTSAEETDAYDAVEAVDARLDALRAVMLPRAVVVRTCGLEPAAYDVESFLAPRRTMLLDGTLTDFSEHAAAGRIDVFGDVAAWFGRYTKTGRRYASKDADHPDDAGGAGVKSVQLVRTAAGWRISAVAWDDERAGLGPHDLRTFGSPA